MKKLKTLLCLLLALCLLCAPALALPSALRLGSLMSPQAQYDLAEEAAVYCQVLHIDSGFNDHPLLRCYQEIFDTDKILSANQLRRALIDWFAKDSDNCELFIDTMLSLYDHHTYFMSQEEYGLYFPETQSYTGIGIRYREYGVFYRVEIVYEGSPAQKAGLRPGDCIAVINGTDIRNLSTEETAEHMAALAGKPITFGVWREGESALFSVEITPAYIDLPNIEYGIAEDGIAFVQIRRFDSQDFFTQLDAAVRFLKKAEFKTLFIDLRDNPGGGINHLLAALNAFIPKEGLEMFRIRSRDGDEVFRSLGGGVSAEIVWVLVNEDSASSSEIFAGVLRDLGLAKLAGAQTYGKARGQMVYYLHDDLIILSVSEVILPVTGYYQGVGLAPDVLLDTGDSVPAWELFTPLDAAAAIGAGSSGEAVLALEQRLALTGYLFGQPDGVFDEGTLAALHALQKTLTLPKNDVASAALLTALDAMTERFADAPGLMPTNYGEILALLH